MVYLILAGILIFLIIFISGFFIGYVFCAKTTEDTVFGTIKWVQDDDGPYLFLDMDRRPEEMVGHNYVMFKTDLKSPSQK